MDQEYVDRELTAARAAAEAAGKRMRTAAERVTRLSRAAERWAVASAVKRLRGLPAPDRDAAETAAARARDAMATIHTLAAETAAFTEAEVELVARHVDAAVRAYNVK